MKWCTVPWIKKKGIYVFGWWRFRLRYCRVIYTTCVKLTLILILQGELHWMCLENLTFHTSWKYLAIRNLVIDWNLFSNLIFQIIDGSKANIYLTVKIWNYYSFIVTCKFHFHYCKLTTIHILLFSSLWLIIYVWLTFILTKL